MAKRGNSEESIYRRKTDNEWIDCIFVNERKRETIHGIRTGI